MGKKGRGVSDHSLLFIWLGFRRVTSKLSNFLHIVQIYALQLHCFCAVQRSTAGVKFRDVTRRAPASNFSSLRTSMSCAYVSYETSRAQELRPVKFSQQLQDISCTHAYKNKAVTFELRLFIIYLQKFKIKNLIFFKNLGAVKI